MRLKVVLHEIMQKVSFQRHEIIKEIVEALISLC